MSIKFIAIAMQIYLLASNFNTDAWRNQFLWYRTHNLLRIITNSKREENPHTLFLVLFECFQLYYCFFFFFFLISFPFFSSIHYVFGPPGLPSRKIALGNIPARSVGVEDKSRQTELHPRTALPLPPPISPAKVLLLSSWFPSLPPRG